MFRRDEPQNSRCTVKVSGSNSFLRFLTTRQQPAMPAKQPAKVARSAGSAFSPSRKHGNSQRCRQASCAPQGLAAMRQAANAPLTPAQVDGS